MGASIYVTWPGASDDEQGGHPGFGNDDRGYAEWLCSLQQSRWLCFRLSMKNMTPLLSVHPVEIAEHKINWTTPVALKKAARALRAELLKETSIAMKLAGLYTNGPGEISPHLELAQDLADVAEIAEYAAGNRARKVTLTIGW